MFGHKSFEDRCFGRFQYFDCTKTVMNLKIAISVLIRNEHGWQTAN